MPRVDDYKQAKELGRKELLGKDPVLIADYSGAKFHNNEKEERFFSINFMYIFNFSF